MNPLLVMIPSLVKNITKFDRGDSKVCPMYGRIHGIAWQGICKGSAEGAHHGPHQVEE